MKKLMLIGRVAAGKTTLTQALRGEEIKYFKTQYVNYLDTVIDTPGEYTERRKRAVRSPCTRTRRMWWGWCFRRTSRTPSFRPV